LQTASDIVSFTRPDWPESEQHPPTKLQSLLRPGGEFASEAGELGFSDENDFAMLHRGRLQVGQDFFGENPLPRDPSSPYPK